MKPDRSVIMTGHQNILLHINGEDPPIITSGCEGADSIVKTEVNHVQLSLHGSEVQLVPMVFETGRESLRTDGTLAEVSPSSEARKHSSVA